MNEGSGLVTIDFTGNVSINHRGFSKNKGIDIFVVDPDSSGVLF